jgi:hypothetical protein
VTPFVTAGGGFLLAVLWFDLMFDVQVLRRQGALPEPVLASIAAYYRRVTTTARPMNRLVAAAMLATIGTLIAQVANGDAPRWATTTSLALAVAAVGLAAAHTVPSAVRLGTRGDSAEEQSALARSICRDHLVCFAAISVLLAVQLAACA